MLAYLGAENAWFAQYAARYQGLETKLFDEIKGRIKQDDSTVPAKKGDWWYYTRYVEGQEYPVYARRRGFVVRNGVETGRAPRDSHDSEAAPEVVMLDVNAMAAGHDFFQVGGMDISPSQKMLAYAQDTVGRRQYEIHFKNLETGETYADMVPHVSGDMGLGRRRQVAVLRRERADDAAQLPRPQARAGYRRQGRRADVRGEGRGLLHERPSHDVGPVHRHQPVVDRVRRAAGAARGRTGWRVQGLRAAPRELPLQRRAHRQRAGRRPLDRAHRLAGTQLQADAGAHEGHRRSCRVAAARAAQRPGLHQRRRPVRERLRHRRTQRWPATPAGRALVGGRELLHRLERAGLHGPRSATTWSRAPTRCAMATRR